MKIYISGIGGSAAAYLAAYYLNQGDKVFGSDLQENSRTTGLRNKGAQIMIGMSDIDWVKGIGSVDHYIYSNAIPIDHPERLYFTEQKTQTDEVGKLTDSLIRSYLAGQLNPIQSQALIESDLLPLAKIDWFGRKYFAVTGTDGKTTTTTMIYHLLRKLKQSAGMISTLGLTINGQTRETGLHTTTPTAQELYALLTSDEFIDSQNVVLEVTSHALSMGRIAGALFDVVVITNITREHLDYHQTWENYFDAKARLITEHLKPNGWVILNRAQSEICERLSQICQKQNVRWIAVDQQSIDSNRIQLPQAQDTPYNRMNAQMALQAVAALYPIDQDQSELLADFAGVNGRMQIMQTRPFQIIIDFAHTQEALFQVLSALRQKLSENGQLRVVFGCAGMRDPGKRFSMGQVAGELADAIYICPEDPRLESLTEINREILRGMKIKTQNLDLKTPKFSCATPGGKIVKVFQKSSPQARQDAIAQAIQDAEKNDIIVICGKGHEQSLCFGTVEYPWSDQATVQGILL